MGEEEILFCLNKWTMHIDNMQQWMVSGRYGRHHESMTSYQTSDSVSQCIFTWRTIRQSSSQILISNEGDLGFFRRSCIAPTIRTTRWEAI